MCMRMAPPALALTSHTGLVKPSGPHHFASSPASVQTLKTSSRGAFRRRVRTISGAADSPLTLFFLVGISFTFFLQLVQIVVQSIETLLPNMPVDCNPSGGGFERRCLQAAWTPLRIAAAHDQTGALEDVEV